MKVYINKEIIDRFKEENISLDYIGTIIVILMCLYEHDYAFLDQIDDFNKSRRLLLLYRYLVRKGFIIEPDEDDEEAEKIHYILTERGIGLTKYLLSFKEDDLEVHKESLPEILANELQVDEWIEEWINIFPEGKYYGRSLRTNKRDCLDRMKWFQKNFFYTKDQIFEATKNYVEDQRTSPDGYRYTRNSTYFICKGRGMAERMSDLATECDKVVNKKANRFEKIDRDSV